VAIPESLIVGLLGVAFAASIYNHYRVISHPAAPQVSMPFWAALAAVLLIFIFLGSGMAWPGWDLRKPLFLGIGVVFFLGAAARLVHGPFWAMR
jgi:hypothetical protein